MRGFTLVELLVVIAIIGLLSAIVLASLNQARAKGRDARRISDIKQLQLALSLYYDSNGKYPTTIYGGGSPLVVNGFISVIPKDPMNNIAYSYTAYATAGAASVCNSYHIGASLETAGSQALQDDANVTTLSPLPGETQLPNTVVRCTGALPDFHGDNSQQCYTGDAGVACFDQTP